MAITTEHSGTSSSSESEETGSGLQNRFVRRLEGQMGLLLASGSALLLVGYLVLVVGWYEFPWGGAFDRASAGTVSEWTLVVLTGMGILGLGYELSQLRRSRLDEAVRESNSVFVSTFEQKWIRRGETPGTLFHIYLRNFGERKITKLNVSVELENGDPISCEWSILQSVDVSFPPRMEAEECLVILHVPSDHSPDINASGLRVRSSWCDAWGRTVEMVDNSPATAGGTP